MLRDLLRLFFGKISRSDSPRNLLRHTGSIKLLNHGVTFIVRGNQLYDFELRVINGDHYNDFWCQCTDGVGTRFTPYSADDVRIAGFFLELYRLTQKSTFNYVSEIGSFDHFIRVFHPGQLEEFVKKGLIRFY